MKNHIIRSYGRIKSRRLSPAKEQLLEQLMPVYLLPHDFKFDPKQKMILEIGFGSGDFLFKTAKENPEFLVIGCEVHQNSIVNLFAKLKAVPLPNLKICTSDVRGLFTVFPEEVLDKAYILFPDPWPKARHYKRRLINPEFLKLLAAKMKPAADLTIATDHDDYKTWILHAIISSPEFSWLANSKRDWQEFPSDWTYTKYQKKALVEGRVPVIFKLKKS